MFQQFSFQVCFQTCFFCAKFIDEKLMILVPCPLECRLSYFLSLKITTLAQRGEQHPKGNIFAHAFKFFLP